MERRKFLVLSATALGLTGCTNHVGDPQDLTRPSSAAPPIAVDDPDAELRLRAAASELGLIASYRAAIAAMPKRAGKLQAFLDQHEAHLTRLAPETVLPSGPIPSTSTDPEVPGSTITLADLVEAEAAAQEQHVTACDGARDPALARDLCLMGASEAQHATYLEALRSGGSKS